VGTLNAILDHTWSSSRVNGLWLTPAGGEAQLMGEIGLNAAVCGHFGAPVLMISATSRPVRRPRPISPHRPAVVKQAKGRNAAECLPPERTTELIEQCAARGVDHLLSEPPPAPLRLAPPITVTVEFFKAEMADSAALLPGGAAGGRPPRVVRRARHARGPPRLPLLVGLA